MTMPGSGELLVIALIVLLLFGAKKLPELSRSVGQSITSFHQGMTEADQRASPGEGERTADGSGFAAEGQPGTGGDGCGNKSAGDA